MHSNASSFVRIVPIFIGMVTICFQWVENAFECFESCSKGLNLHSNALNLVEIFHSTGSNLHWNALNPFRMVRICIRMLRILSNGYNLHLNASNLVTLPWLYFTLHYSAMALPDST